MSWGYFLTLVESPQRVKPVCSQMLVSIYMSGFWLVERLTRVRLKANHMLLPQGEGTPIYGLYTCRYVLQDRQPSQNVFE